MALLNKASPHARGNNTTNAIMQQVIFALLPGIAVMTVFFGAGVLANIVWLTVCAIASEALILRVRKRPVMPALQDGSAVVTALLLALALPPFCPWWISLFGILFAIIVAKQLFGGLGLNVFNPAMAGYALLLVCFPQQLSQWHNIDGTTMATPLDIVKHNHTLLMEQLWQSDKSFGSFSGAGWEWVNVAFMLGGIYLLLRKIISWHAPLCMLITLALCSAPGYDDGSAASHGSPVFHLFSGATMLGAWFIITDPVTSATSKRGRMIFGACTGVLVYVLRIKSAFPDAIAFAVLTMNFFAPFIDRFTQPVTYGYGKHPEAE